MIISSDPSGLPRYTFKSRPAHLRTRKELTDEGLQASGPAAGVVEWRTGGVLKTAWLFPADGYRDPERARREAIRWADRLLYSDAVILDTETTGLDTSTSRVVQIAAIDMRGEVLLDTLVDPGVPIPPETTALHGITDDTVAGAPPFAKVLPAVTKALAGRRRGVVVYNRDYDRPLLIAEIDRVRGEGTGVTWAKQQVAAWRCAMGAWSRYQGEWDDELGDWRRHRLPAGDHTALGDCRATLALLQRIATDDPLPEDTA
ncbi:3'-5' exonuclease [Bailinhaonella thermotolerans]|nr:3'-5' exonuclease [Bailinhaonella thermotolerans]